MSVNMRRYSWLSTLFNQGCCSQSIAIFVYSFGHFSADFRVLYSFLGIPEAPGLILSHFRQFGNILEILVFGLTLGFVFFQKRHAGRAILHEMSFIIFVQAFSQLRLEKFV